MTPSNLEEVLNKMEAIFENIANYEHEPRRFLFQYKMAEYYLEREKKYEHILSV